MGVHPIHGMRTAGEVLATMTGPARLIEALGSPKLRGDEPGVRMVAGKPYVFNGGLLGDYRATLAVEADHDIPAMSDADLKALEKHTMRALYVDAFRNDGDKWTALKALRHAVGVELTARGFLSDGTSVPVAAQMEDAA